MTYASIKEKETVNKNREKGLSRSTSFSDVGLYMQ